MNSTTPIALRPISDAEHGWAAMLLSAEVLPDAAAQQHLFGDIGLAAALDGLPCVVPAFGSVDEVPADAFVRPVSAAVATDAVAPAVPPACGDGPCLVLNVDSFSAFERCRKSGFNWFAGNYPLHPMPGMATRNAARHAVVLQLLTLITHDADTGDIEQVVKHDPQLSYQLLRLVNSVAFLPGQRITSFSHAITMLGRKPMQRWLQLLLYARPESTSRSPLLPRAAMRAAFMEALFATGSPEVRDQAFMVGMFSLLDVMMNENLAKLLAPLHLPGEVNRALQDRGGPLGLALNAVEAGETGAAPLAEAVAAVAIDPAVWNRALVGACHWSVRVSREA